MGNKFYQPGQERAGKVSDLFATVAPRYDLINDLQSLGAHRFWKRRLVRLAAPRRGEAALDLCCGTGDIAFSLAAAGAEVTALDFSQPMLAVALRRAQILRGKAPAPNLSTDAGIPRFVVGDAQQIPFPDESFDIVTVGYGLRNLASWEKGVAEMWRVAKPGGRLLVLDFGKPEHRAWRWIYFSYLRWMVPLFGRLFCGDAETHRYILESLQEYPAQRGVDAILHKAGATEIGCYNLLGGAMSINYARKSGELVGHDVRSL